MERRLALFLLCAVAILAGNAYLSRWMAGPQPNPAQQAQAEGQKGEAAGDEPATPEAADGTAAPDAAGTAKTDTKSDATDANPAEPAAAGAEPPALQPDLPVRRVALGSLDPASPYKMLVTLTSLGAACERIELNSPRYRDSEFDGAYLGHLGLGTSSDPKGASVGVVGPGTPAGVAGLKVNDVITAIGPHAVGDWLAVEEALAKFRPGDEVTIHVMRAGQPVELTARLARKPLDVVQPENSDPLTLELTLAQLDDQKLDPQKADLPNLPLSNRSWELVSNDESQATFRWALPTVGLEVLKKYRLARVAVAGQDPEGPSEAFHLVFDVEIKNTGMAPHQVAYRLGGPTGLPTEGWWYANKISRTWTGGGGVRDVIVATDIKGRASIETVSGIKLAGDKEVTRWKNEPIVFAGVDAQYFAAMLIPQKKSPDEVWFADLDPRRVGPVPADKNRLKLTDVSFRATTVTEEIKPGESGLEHTYFLFAGPKVPAVLAAYGLDGIVYYGWFGTVSRWMLAILHFFHDTLHVPYAIAIILLTVLVRSAMFPLSRRQAISAQKMQELAPEMKKLAEKYKNNMEARSKAQQELFRKHNYNPLAGCLPMFIQLPIFIGLYRSLSVDVELRQAPLISESVRWASNLAAPDQLFSWESWMPAFAQSWLGPYFNVLPCLTIGLFIWQQKMFMPPPTDEQAAMQQKMMQYMMIIFGVMFFRVPSGLCVYFIASSLWGIAERKLLPKSIKKSPAGEAATTITVASRPAAE
ncbi:MAG: YidC/Oxa1 family insertase periplasmic-domain containing protein, partial [Planctomycetaceae bacterium]|nr:YidC/Oxa1 family insertase periplasmic-domain containing protein [Planctomycetaceae bacterium]